ncbi:uncharacterized protein [Palaemon carinicauda]|uniref:uncharacterized protein n=1 Tax=Palaemon carinicauda TaxID=392227 RepID=UPI0035B6AA97
MMPPRVSRSSSKFKKPAAPASKPPPADSSSDDEPINVYLPSKEETAMLSAESQSDDGTSQASQIITLGQSTLKAKKSRPVMLSRVQEQDVADWYREREWLYNFRSEAYKDTRRKDSAYEEKAAELGISSIELKTWVKSKKDLAAKILKQKTSGSEVKPMTDREQWVFKNFCHAAGFVKRVGEHKRKRAEQLSPQKAVFMEPAEGLTQPIPCDDLLLNNGSDFASEAASSKGGTCVIESSTATLDQLAQHTQQLVTMLKRQEYLKDSRDGNRRALADLIYYASARMDDDTFDEFQAQCFTLISNYQLAARRKRDF